MLNRLFEKKAELLKEIGECEAELARAKGKLDLIQELIDEETAEEEPEEADEEEAVVAPKLPWES